MFSARDFWLQLISSFGAPAVMPLLKPPRSEWDLLSNTKKVAPVPPKFFVPVDEENPIGVAQTGLKQLGGVVKCVHSAR